MEYPYFAICTLTNELTKQSRRRIEMSSLPKTKLQEESSSPPTIRPLNRLTLESAKPIQMPSAVPSRKLARSIMYSTSVARSVDVRGCGVGWSSRRHARDGRRIIAVERLCR